MTLSKHCLYRIYKNLSISPTWRSSTPTSVKLASGFGQLEFYTVLYYFIVINLSIEFSSVQCYFLSYSFTTLKRKLLEYWDICSNCYSRRAEQEEKNKTRVKQVPLSDHPYSQLTQVILYYRQNVRHSSEKFGILFPNFIIGQLCSRNFPFLCPRVQRSTH